MEVSVGKVHYRAQCHTVLHSYVCIAGVHTSLHIYEHMDDMAHDICVHKDHVGTGTCISHYRVDSSVHSYSCIDVHMSVCDHISLCMAYVGDLDDIHHMFPDKDVHTIVSYHMIFYSFWSTYLLSNSILLVLYAYMATPL